ncbi:MAG TPA: hypothetical protein VK982_12205 [Bacteroidales bacterium]|nr:hypothetical protein [Bacteroidales bacterium]
MSELMGAYQRDYLSTLHRMVAYIETYCINTILGIYRNNKGKVGETAREIPEN